VAILGGAGFLGSRIAELCVRAGHAVTIFDGFLERTSGRRENLRRIASDVELVDAPIERVADLEDRIASSDAVVDCMGWTRHRAALEDPLYDLALNLASHVHWLHRIPAEATPRVIYLGSRGQYGEPAAAEIGEEAPLDPRDVQGIHKAAAEGHFRLVAELRRLHVTSLRLPACIGPNQPTEGEDIGLVGGLVREALAGRPLRVYGRGRRRAVAFVDDVAEIVVRLLEVPGQGFEAYNVRGAVATIDAIAARLVEIVGRGRVEVAELPPDVAAIDIGLAVLAEEKLRAVLGSVPGRAIDDALRLTVAYFEEAAR
jgi:nucleoside-diphosphate-sugar epimerase